MFFVRLFVSFLCAVCFNYLQSFNDATDLSLCHLQCLPEGLAVCVGFIDKAIHLFGSPFQLYHLLNQRCFL